VRGSFLSRSSRGSFLFLLELHSAGPRGAVGGRGHRCSRGKATRGKGTPKWWGPLCCGCPARGSGGPLAAVAPCGFQQELPCGCLPGLRWMPVGASFPTARVALVGGGGASQGSGSRGSASGRRMSHTLGEGSGPAVPLLPPLPPFVFLELAPPFWLTLLRGLFGVSFLPLSACFFLFPRRGPSPVNAEDTLARVAAPAMPRGPAGPGESPQGGSESEQQGVSLGRGRCREAGHVSPFWR